MLENFSLSSSYLDLTRILCLVAVIAEHYGPSGNGMTKSYENLIFVQHFTLPLLFCITGIGARLSKSSHFKRLLNISSLGLLSFLINFFAVYLQPIPYQGDVNWLKNGHTGILPSIGFCIHQAWYCINVAVSILIERLVIRPNSKILAVLFGFGTIALSIGKVFSIFYARLLLALMNDNMLKFSIHFPEFGILVWFIRIRQNATYASIELLLLYSLFKLVIPHTPLGYYFLDGIVYYFVGYLVKNLHEPDTSESEEVYFDSEELEIQDIPVFTE